MSKKPKILVVGSFVMDLIVRTSRVPNEGETVLDGIDFRTATGGKGENQAVQAARLGAEVTMVGRVGKDMFGDQLLKSAEDSGINVEHIYIDENSCSGVGNITLHVREGMKAQNRIIVVPGANMMVTLKDVKFLEDTINEYDMLIIQQEIPPEINEAVTSYAYAKGVPVMLNPAPSRKVSDEFLSKLTYISPNEYEAADITGVDIEKNSNSVDIDSVKKASKVLLDKGVKNVIITLGSLGVSFMNKDKFLYVPCIDIVDAVDPTAAGDSFTAAFCTGICMGMDEKEALDFASYTATLTVSRMGAQPSLPHYDEVLELMKSNKNSVKGD
jgi:ribokinase